MGVWSEVEVTRLSGTRRLDGDYYAPHFLQAFGQLAGNARGMTLRDVVRVRNDRFRPIRGGQFEYIEISGVSTVLGTYRASTVSDEEAPSRAQYLVSPNVILLSTVRPNRSAVALVKELSTRTVCSSGFLVLEPTGTTLEYLFAFLKVPVITSLFDRETTATMYPAVPEKDCLSLPFPTPRKSVESEVSELVNAACAELLRAESEYATAERSFLSALQLAILNLTPRLFCERGYKDVSAAARLDAEYYQPKYTKLLDHLRATRQAVRLGDFLGESPTRGLQPLYDETGDILVINSQHVGTQSIDLESNEKTTAPYAARSNRKGCVRQYDVLLNSTGYITIGRCQAMLENVAGVVDSHVTILRPNPELDPVYLAMFLNTQPGFLQTERGWTGSSGQIELRLETIQDFTVWLAPKDIQQGIRSKVEAAHAARREARRLLDEAKGLVEGAILTPASSRA